jgi:pilus assembly protein Flp/PilA
MISRAKDLRHHKSSARKPVSSSAAVGGRHWGQIARFLDSDEGPTTVEYGFMLMLVVAVCLLSVKLLGNKTQTSFSNSANSIKNAFTSSS